MVALFLVWPTLKAINLWVAQDWGSKCVCIGLVMTMSIKVWIPFLMSTMSTRRQEELNMVEKCNYSRPMWKLTSYVITTKMLWIASWVPMCSLPLAQCKRWISIGLLGCVHTHQKIPIILKYGNPNFIRSTMKKFGENYQKAGKFNRIIS